MMFEVTVRMRFYDHRAHSEVPNHDLVTTFKTEKKETISEKVEQMVTATCMKVNPKITNIQIHRGYEQHVGKFSNLFKKDPYDFTNTSDCAVLQKWNDHEYHLCKRVAPLKYLSKRNCYAGLLEDVQYNILVHFDYIGMDDPNYNY